MGFVLPCICFYILLVFYFSDYFFLPPCAGNNAPANLAICNFPAAGMAAF